MGFIETATGSPMNPPSPNEILHEIFMRCDANDLLSIVAVCRQWRDVLADTVRRIMRRWSRDRLVSSALWRAPLIYFHDRVPSEMDMMINNSASAEALRIMLRRRLRVAPFEDAVVAASCESDNPDKYLDSDTLAAALHHHTQVISAVSRQAFWRNPTANVSFFDSTSALLVALDEIAAELMRLRASGKLRRSAAIAGQIAATLFARVERCRLCRRPIKDWYYERYDESPFEIVIEPGCYAHALVSYITKAYEYNIYAVQVLANINRGVLREIAVILMTMFGLYWWRSRDCNDAVAAVPLRFEQSRRYVAAEWFQFDTIGWQFE